MLRSELIASLQARLHDVPPADVELAVATMLDAIAEALVRGGRVEIRGFGSLATHTVPGRPARNPKTGAPVWIPARRRIAYKAGRALRARVAYEGRAFPDSRTPE